MDEPHNSQHNNSLTQHNPTTIQTIKRIDPIWKYLRLARIGNVGYFVLAIILLAFRGTTYWSAESPFTILIIAFGGIATLTSQVRQERYWRRIGTQRLAALQDPTPFTTRSRFISDAALLPLPASVNLFWSRRIRMTLIIGYLILLALLATGIISLVIQWRKWLFILTLLCGVLVIIVSLLLASCFITAYKNVQSIEVTDEGITTRYRRQLRTIRWDEARLFAEYNANGVKKNTSGQAYELSNDQTIVRWSQRSNFSLFLTPQSNVPIKYLDFNSILKRVNATVSARTGLPLLNLDQQTPQSAAKHIKQARPIPSSLAIPPVETQNYTQPDPQLEQTEVHLEHPAPQATFNPHDPLVERARPRGEVLLGFGLMAGVGLIMTIIGVVNHSLWAGGTLTIGVPLLALGLLILMLLFFTQRYWQHYAQRRQLAVQDPQAFLAQTQPTPVHEAPQPAQLALQIRPLTYFVMTFATALIIVFILSMLTNFSLAPGRLLGALVFALIFAVLAGLLSLFLARVVGRSQIVITPNSLTSHLNTVEMAVNWQDVRLFSTYKTLGAGLLHARTRQYELASDYMIVRWQVTPGRFGLYRPQPHMSNEDYERWQEQFCGYIVARTGVPLVDLDHSQFTNSQP